MNVLRILKIKELYGELDDMSRMHKAFLPYFENLYLEKSLDDNNLYFLKSKLYRNEWFFVINTKDNSILVNYAYVFVTYRANNDLRHDEAVICINKFMRKYLNLSYIGMP